MSAPAALEAFCRGALDQGWSNLHWFGFVSACLFSYVFVGGICQRLSGQTADVAPYGLVWPFVLPWQIGSGLAAFVTRTHVPAARVIERKDGGR